MGIYIFRRLLASIPVLFGILIISFPEFLSYLIGGFFLFIGLNIVLFNLGINNMKNKSNSDDR